MKYDFYAEFRGTQPQDMNRIMEAPGLDLATRIRLLALTNAAEGLKEMGRAEYRDLVHVRGHGPTSYDGYCADQMGMLGRLRVATPAADCLDLLPNFSVWIQFPFVLSRPYLSKDDEPFHIIDNPVRKEKVFRVPMVASTSWKGSLRWAATKCLVDRALSPEDFAHERLRLTRLFGDEKGEETGNIQALARFLDKAGGKEAAALYRQMVKRYFRRTADDPMPHHAGRLNFFPTFFSRMDLEVINPHVRERKVGTVPILLECVPKGSRGDFVLLYLPFDRVGLSEADPERGFRPLGEEVLGDTILVATAIRFMFTESGFGAKTSAGFGVARERLAEDGLLCLRVEEARVPPEPPKMPLECEPFLVDGELPLLKPKEWQERMGATKREVKAYGEAKAAYLAYREALEAYEREMQVAKEAPRWWERSFATFDELVKRAEETQGAILESRPTGGEER